MNEVSFRNSYLLMRHGESDANVSGVIVSDPKIGCERFGLTDRGSKQIIASVKGFTGEAITQIVCSDFLRTLQTAQLVANTLNLPQPEQEVGLRERFFGKWEGMSAEHYENIWQRDEMDKHSDDGVERPQEVAQRGLMVLERLEQQYQGEVILLVSHGDMLQILSTSIAGISPHKHRSLPHHQTGEIKYLVTEHK
jgi:probable phosphoglycerate mutase|tara:strand:+ start:327 stop:911 length:585 start_codon:yes stop_codon:yes gene_type:complete